MQREQQIAQLNTGQGPWDLLVIGGGASGLGIALDSVTRGYRTLLLERGDFAEGTSSRSTKLIHGGIRYLRQGNFVLIRKALVERARLLRNASHLVHRCSFIIPAEHSLGVYYYQAGIKLYDMLAGDLNLNRSCRLSRERARSLLPNVLPKRIAGGVLYDDGQFDDARLAINLAQTIVDQGGTVLNYMSLESFLKCQGKIVGVIAKDMETGREYEIQAKGVVNATGASSDIVRQMDQPNAKACLAFSQGAHIVLPRRFFPADHAMVIPTTRDGRVLFLIPWHHRVLVGTTETPLDSFEREPRAQASEISYLLETVGRYLINVPRQSDILSCFAGIRPLVKPALNWLPRSMISRDHVVMTSPSQLTSVIGGKWTTYRQLAQDTVDVAAKVARLAPATCKTQDLRIHGWESTSSESYYGADYSRVEQMAEDHPELKNRLHNELPCRGIDVIWSIRNEMARTLEDIFARRTLCLFLDTKASYSIAPQVAQIMARELGHDEIWQHDQVNKLIDRWRLSANEKKITK